MSLIQFDLLFSYFVCCLILQADTWLSATLNALKHERTTDRDIESLKARVEGLYRQKQTREADIDRIKTVARQLIDDPTTADKHRLRETLGGVQGKWNDLTERLVQMISYTVCVHRHRCYLRERVENCCSCRMTAITSEHRTGSEISRR